MPKTDYSDSEIKFPRLQVRIWTIDGKTQFIDVWLWKVAGGERLQIFKSHPAGNMQDAHRLIRELMVKHGAECDADDITVEG